jgi:arabinofuranosyltransferase
MMPDVAAGVPQATAIASARRGGRAERARGAAIFLASLAVFLALAHLYGSTRIGGLRHWVLHDDFMISERYARNLAQGHGLVFNPGERVEGFSNPLTTLGICLPLELVGVEGRKLGLFVWFVNGALSSLIVLALVFGRSGKLRPPLVGCLAALVYLSLPHHGFFARSGMEVYVQAFLIVVVVTRLREGGLAFYLALAALPLAHAIDLPLGLSAAALRLWRERGRWLGEVRSLALAALPAVAYFVFRLLYYQDVFPNTYYLKAGDVMAPMRGARYLLAGAAWIAPLLVLAVMGLWRGRDGKDLSLLELGVFLIPFLIFVAKVGGDNFEWYRFVFILVPAVIELVAEAFASMAGARWAPLFLAGAAIQLGTNAWGYRHADGDIRWLLGWDRARVALGYGIKDNTEPGQTVALFGIGNAAYFGERYVIDMLGKAEAHIAHELPKGGRRVGHQKDDPDYVMSRRPDFVEMSYKADELADIDRLEQERHGRWGYFSELALNPVFRRDYSPVESDRGGVPIYVRNDLLPERWVVLPELVLP